MSIQNSLTVLDLQLLTKLGKRLRALRQAQGLGGVEMAKRAGISRMTLQSVESGSPAPSIGTYLKVMSTLGLEGELRGVKPVRPLKRKHLRLFGVLDLAK